MALRFVLFIQTSEINISQSMLFAYLSLPKNNPLEARYRWMVVSDLSYRSVLLCVRFLCLFSIRPDVHLHGSPIWAVVIGCNCRVPDDGTSQTLWGVSRGATIDLEGDLLFALWILGIAMRSLSALEMVLSRGSMHFFMIEWWLIMPLLILGTSYSLWLAFCLSFVISTNDIWNDWTYLLY